MNIEFPPYYKKAIAPWLVSEGFEVTRAGKDAARLDLYLDLAVTPTHIVFALRRAKNDAMLCALKLERHYRDAPFVEKISFLCSKS